MNIGLKEELSNFLQNAKRNQANTERDIGIILSYYGFGTAVFPTLEDLSNKFSLGTRERVRQIINKYFRLKKNCNPSSFPLFGEFHKYIKDLDFIDLKDMVLKLKAKDINFEAKNIFGLLRFFDDVGFGNNHLLFNAAMVEVTGNRFSEVDPICLMGVETHNRVREIQKKLFDAPGQMGIVSKSAVYKDADESEATNSAVNWIFKNNKGIWKRERGEEIHFLIENRSNTLTNFFGKVFNIVEEIDVGTLAVLLTNALHSRTPRFGTYPDSELVKSYLIDSKFIEVENGVATYSGELTNLSDIESDIVEYFQHGKVQKYGDLKGWLTTKGHGDALITKACNNSAIVFVDKSNGPRHYLYNCVSNIGVTKSKNQEERYNKYKAQLEKLLSNGTDKEIAATTRREQKILSNWLFKNKTHQECAICGEEFSISSLVTAHKKLRNKCSEIERTDPHIVMPLCKFGCDYLYEADYIGVENKKFKLNSEKDMTSIEYIKAKKFEGKTMHEFWLEDGGNNYLKSF